MSCHKLFFTVYARNSILFLPELGEEDLESQYEELRRQEDGQMEESRMKENQQNKMPNVVRSCMKGQKYV